MEENGGAGAVKKTVFKIGDGERLRVEDSIAVETKLRVSINGKAVLTLYCTPVMIRELVTGFFITEGIIKAGFCPETISITRGGDEITADITAEGEADMEGGVITSGCAGGLSFPEKITAGAADDPLSISAESLFELSRRFQNMSGLHRLTGCVHSAALTDGKDILAFAEDIGRHNAIDKVIGYCLLEKIDFRGKILLTSGRVSSEAALKCARWSIPVIASRAAPTALALEIAERNGLTVAGFLRGSRMNVYTRPERIL